MANLLLFNMKMDTDDGVLGFTTDWVNELAGHFDKVFVITHTAGKIQVSENVRVYSVGREKGYNELHRVFEFYRLLRGILRHHQIDYCFIHMIQIFAVLAAPVLKWHGIPMTMWYGHQATPLSLHLAHALVDKVVTSTESGFQIPSNKKACVGQGITESKFPLRLFRKKKQPYMLVNVSRLSPSKNIHALLDAVALFANKHGKNSIRLYLIGDALNERDCRYKADLDEMVKNQGMEDNVVFCGSVPHAKVCEYLSACDLSTNMAPAEGSVDKAALEAMAMGVPIVLQNRSFGNIFAEAGIPADEYIVPNIRPETLLYYFESLLMNDSSREYEKLQILSQCIHRQHGLKGLASRISKEIVNTRLQNS
ncbi:MAG: hypothetical protein CVV42_05030 [Candidatus Riflebacteria bacterium HGW-Riflebacteria-2]|nr:MAG: hypothetical protein CVV42_05030 [Candidatus Riflebacteria bacterium HGW-Riflebacteria-2]